jgi:glycosyltransferase involved in cell wall biosynthesis
MTAPAVTIILPTYNRAAFLAQAFESIRTQALTDWELVVVDDGSTDETRELVEQFRATTAHPVRYIHQENQGAYGARNTGLDAARGRYVAFFDSDDVWLPHHLADCVAALERNPDVDWAYGACRVVDLGTNRVTAPSTFYIAEQPRPFLGLQVRADGAFRVIDDPRATECMILDGMYNGLQNSVIRRTVFAQERFRTHFRNEAEDQLIVVRALVARRRIGYFDNIHVVYHEHAANSSAAGSDRRLEKLLEIYGAEARGYQELADEVPLTPAQKRAVRRRLSRSYFWLLGYNLLWQHGRRVEALDQFRRGLRLQPWNLKYWKTYLLAAIRVRLGIGTRV